MIRRLGSLSVVLAVVAGVAAQAAPHHALPGLERGLPAKVRGLVTLGELGCARCHETGVAVAARFGPRLDAVGSRIDPFWIERFLRDPQAVKPGTVMPHVLAKFGGLPLEQAATALTHFLVSRSEGEFTPGAPDPVAAARGRVLFHTIGCVACHAPRDEKGEEQALAGSVPLGRLEHKYCVRSLAAFLDAPLEVRPSGRMPHFGLAPRESADLANYLLARVSVPAPLRFVQFEPAGQVLPGSEERFGAKAMKSGVTQSLDVTRFRDSSAGLVVDFRGYLVVPKSAKYTFEVETDGGARLAFGGATYLRLATPGKKEVAIDLSAGRHAVAIGYDGAGRRDRRKFVVRWSAPGQPRAAIPMSAFQANLQNRERKVFVLDAAQAKRGAQLYTELRCASCHEPDKQPQRTAPKLRGADLDKGCAASETPRKHRGPHYVLSARQRADLRVVLGGTPPELDAEQRIQRDLATFHCYACHQRGEVGGVPAARDEFFQSHGESLGVSSRIPPPLTGVGAKLRREWLRQTLLHGQSIRPMMKTRMPGFGRGAAALAAGLSGQDSLPEVVFEPLPKDRKKANAFRDEGKKLVGNQGMNCIACHQFAGQSASTMRSVDLVDSTAQRLQRDWFYHYMINPVRFRPGTIMPLFFPGGQSTHKEVLGGDTKRQIQALWSYLEKGRNVRKPRGLIRPQMHVAVGSEFAVMLRRSAQNTGKRAISVGLPTGVSFTFDAETLALNQVWWGAFIDAGGVWSGQGSGQVRPLERERGMLPLGPVFATLPRPDAPWPTATRRELGHRFRGYTLDDRRRPTFEYEVEGVRVLDKCEGVPQNGKPAVLRRTLTFHADRARTLSFRAALDATITERADELRVGRWLDVRLPRGTTRVIRPVSVGEKGKQQQKQEVVVTIPIAGHATFIVDYVKREDQ